jgi:iron complex outermembrane receptor protein
MKLRVLSLAIAMAYLSPALAQTPAPQTPVSPDEAGTGAQKLDTVVITGTRTERRLQEVPGSISVVGEKQLERSQPQYLGDELATVPGIFLNREEQGSYNTVIIRGVPTRHHNDTFLLLLDGIPRMSANEEVDMDFLPVEAVRRVEVVKGPMSALYGRGGVAGTLSYFTLDPFAAGNSVGLKVGSFGTYKPFGTFSQRLSDDAALMVAASHEKSDGWADDAQRKSSSLFVKGSWLIGPESSLDVALLHHRNRQGLSSYVPLAADGSVIELPRGRRANNNIDDAHADRQTDTLYAIWNQRLTADWKLKLSASLGNRDGTYKGGFWNSYDAAARTISWLGFEGITDARTGYLDAQFTGQVGAHRIVAGVSHEQTRAKPIENWTGAPFTFYEQLVDVTTGRVIDPASFITDQRLRATSRARVSSLYLQDEIDLAAQWRLTVGLRHDRFSRKVSYAEGQETIFGDPNGTIPAEQADGDGSRTSPKLGLTWNLAPTTSLYASYGEGYSPALGPIWAFAGRPRTLKPEIARGYEVGAKGSALGGTLGYAVALYRLDRKDLAEWVSNGNGTFSYINIGKQRSQGLEVETSWKLDALSRGLSAYANYAYVDAKWIDKDIVDEFSGTPYNFSGNKVPGAPPHQLALGAAYEPGTGFGFYGGVQRVGSYFIDQPNTAKGKGYTTVDAGISYRPAALPGLLARLHVKNLTDKTYYNYFGGNDGPLFAAAAAPRDVSLTVSYRF